MYKRQEYDKDIFKTCLVGQILRGLNYAGQTPALERPVGQQKTYDSLGVESPRVYIPAVAANQSGSAILIYLDRIAAALESLAEDSHRNRAHVAPEPGDVVGTPYLASQLGCSVVWAAEMARNGEIPKSCIVPGTGNGKVWKFYRQRIEEWLVKR